MQKFNRIIKFLKNKYVFISLIFIVWVSFFDSFSLIKRYKSSRNLKKLQQDRKYYKEEIKKDSIALWELRSGPASLEKFARERYLMKKDSEDIFIVIKKIPEKK